MTTRALILSGGSFRGAVQIPVINYLKQEHDYDAVFGVSVGAINGSMFAQDDLDTLTKMWHEVDGIKGFLSLKWYFPFQGLFSMKPLRKKIESFVDLSKIKIPFSSGVVSFTDGEYYSLSTEKMTTNKELWQAIEASSCMSGIMVPPEITINGEKHIGADGGFRNIIPVPKKTRFDFVDIVACTPLDRMKMKKEKYYHRDICNTAMRAIEVFEDENFDKDVLELKNTQHGIVRIFTPDEYPGSPMEAGKDVIDFRFKLGEKAIKNPLIITKNK